MSNIFYVNNLEQAVDLGALESLFTTVGDVESLRLVKYHESTRLFGIVEMKTPQEAVDCVERFNGQSVVGHTLSMSANKPKPQPRRAK